MELTIAWTEDDFVEQFAERLNDSDVGMEELPFYDGSEPPGFGEGILLHMHLEFQRKEEPADQSKRPF